MTRYSTPQEIADFEIKLSKGRVLFIDDLDGNLYDGFNAVAGQTLPPLGLNDVSETQSIAFGTSLAEIDHLVEKGALVKKIFAQKGMDVRLPKKLVDVANYLIVTENCFSFAPLTSRPANAVLKILSESGVKNSEQLTIVADSGATLFVNGEQIFVRKLSAPEQKFLRSIDSDYAWLKQKVQFELHHLGFDVTKCPDLIIEHKGIGSNVHYRTILDAYGQPDQSDLDKALGSTIKACLQLKAQRGLTDEFGDPTFMTLDGPATVELKVAKINKGHGLESIVAAAMASATPPTAIVFSGDDITKSNGEPGTDYFAALRAKSLSKEIGIPIYVVHTLHPEGGDINGTAPDLGKAVDMLNPKYERPDVHLILSTPAETAALNVRVLNRQAVAELQKMPLHGQGLGKIQKYES